MSPLELRVLRDALGLTTGGAALLCGVDDRTFRRWLDGTREPNPSAVRLMQLAEDVPEARAWLETHATLVNSLNPA